jgi:long-subunit acyl-CoA synthetase (AMP-forming)
MTSVQDLREFANLPRDEVAARVEAALDEASLPTTSGSESLELDRAAIEALRQPQHVDSLLGAFDLERLSKLPERCIERLRASGDPPNITLRALVWDVLDLIRRPEVLRRIEGTATEAWAQRILSGVEASHLTVGPLFRQRAATYGSKVLFELPDAAGSRSMTWNEVAARVDTFARALVALAGPEQATRVAIISENRFETALLDLACLTSGIVNVMVPANATEADVGYILRHSAVDTVIVSRLEQLHKVHKNRDSLPKLRQLITIDPLSAPDVMTLQELEAHAVRIPSSMVRQKSEAVRIDDLATVMYTSGTTGTPKGIQFSHRNLVFKRFARALALPAIGDHDVFVAYLPLFHTFGRFLEMLGCVFWGAKYCFLLNPSVDALTEAMRRHRPTVFISVPKKWMQLYEAISQRAHPVEATDEELLTATQNVTGGRLRWGLSAAGYLDPDIFRFFHRQGIDLLSGFGMTEATGGATMTPPGQYRENSVGKALPGIELKLGEDGELLIRGPYMMMGYLDPVDGAPSFDKDGWFHSGDLARMDDDGHIQLIDRKKEIYKNINGETIAPQRIENLFREFESVGRPFLVGDHQEYNTLLIYPNPSYKELDLSSLSAQDVREHFRSLVVSVNEFVAPFERIVDFAVIDRDLDPERGELTPKGTPRRKAVADNFAEIIDSLYRRISLHVGGVDVIFPNWLLQILGLKPSDRSTTG